MSGAIQSSVDKRDYIFKSTITSLPPTFEVKKLQPARNQGNTQTCAAQVAACIKEYQENIDIGFNEYFSPQYVFDRRSDLTMNGMTGRDTMRVLLKNGIVPEKLYPFGKTSTVEQSVLTETASNFKIGGYANINSIYDAKAALIQNGPIYVSFLIYNTSATPWKQLNGEQNIGGHAMTIIGYNKDGFIIRNSWGSDWNKDGHCIFPYSDWGLQWEIYTTIDLESNDYVIPVITTTETTTVTAATETSAKETETSAATTAEKKIEVTASKKKAVDVQGCCTIC